MNEIGVKIKILSGWILLVLTLVIALSINGNKEERIMFLLIGLLSVLTLLKNF